uniref:Uncharacterized protein n=1 Tax=Setaria digitata TaxID=48799 RepID=A0A915PWN0_9BILA
MSSLGRRHEWNRPLAKETATASISNSSLAPNYLFPRGLTTRGPIGRPTALEKRYFEPSVDELYNFERPSFEKQSGSRIQGVSFSFKMPSAYRMEKGELIVSSVKKTYSDADLKLPVRTTVQRVSSSEFRLPLSRQLGRATLEKAKTALVPRFLSDNQNLSDGKIPNVPECMVKTDLCSSFPLSPKKRKSDSKADLGPPSKLKKKVDPKKRVLLMGKAISMAPSFTEAGPSDEAVGPGKKCFPGVIFSSRLSAALNRNSEWEKLAMKSKSLFLKHRSQKMLKDRLEKYCVMTRKPHIYDSEKLDTKKTNQTPIATPLTIKEALPKFNQGFVDLFSSGLNKKKVEQSGTLSGNSENRTVIKKSVHSKKNSTRPVSEFSSQDAKKISSPSGTGILPLTSVGRNSRKVTSSRMKDLSLIGESKDAAEIEVKKEVESLVEKALLQTAASSYFRPSQDLRKNVVDSVQGGVAVDVTNDDAKLKKMWALVAEESSLTRSLNDVTAKITKVKADLCALSSESCQVPFVTFPKT